MLFDQIYHAGGINYINYGSSVPIYHSHDIYAGTYYIFQVV